MAIAAMCLLKACLHLLVLLPRQWDISVMTMHQHAEEVEFDSIPYQGVRNHTSQTYYIAKNTILRQNYVHTIPTHRRPTFCLRTSPHSSRNCVFFVFVSLQTHPFCPLLFYSIQPTDILTSNGIFDLSLLTGTWNIMTQITQRQREREVQRR